MADAAVELELPDAHEAYPGKLRRVAFHDAETDRDYVSLTNDFRLAAATIAAVYRRRWQIELFLKWRKQNLPIRSFLGTSENAVMTQTWVAPMHFLLVAYIKFLSKLKISLTEITARIRKPLMGDSHLPELLSLDRRTLAKPPAWNAPRQLGLFGEFSA